MYRLGRTLHELTEAVEDYLALSSVVYDYHRSEMGVR